MFIEGFCEESEKLALDFRAAKTMVEAQAPGAAVRRLPKKHADVIGAVFERDPDKKTETFRLPRKVRKEIVYHELGHREQPGVFFTPSYRAMEMASPLTAAGLAALAAKKAKGKLRLASPLIAAAGFTPTLVPEYSASARAYNMMKRDLGPELAKERLKTGLGPAFGTYLIAPSVTAGGIGAYALWNALKDRKAAAKVVKKIVTRR